MKPTLPALLLAATALMSAPALAADTKTAPAKPAKAVEKPAANTNSDYVIMKVGGEPIKLSEVVDTWKSLFPNGNAPDFNSFDENIRQNVLRGLASEHLIYGEAVKEGVDKYPEVKKRLATVEHQVIMQAFMEQKAKALVTDGQLKAAYEEKIAENKGKEEVKARHILVPTEEEARKIADELKKGADFEKIAKERSTDKGSGANGGELGWFTKEKMVPEFADAAFKLKKGEVSDPIKTSFGWHVIQVEDRRPVQTPSFDDMKESLKGELANKAMQTYVENLLKGANVKYYGPDGKEKPFSPVLAPAAKPAAATPDQVEKQ